MIIKRTIVGMVLMATSAVVFAASSPCPSTITWSDLNGATCQLAQNNPSAQSQLNVMTVTAPPFLQYPGYVYANLAVGFPNKNQF